MHKQEREDASVHTRVEGGARPAPLSPVCPPSHVGLPSPAPWFALFIWMKQYCDLLLSFSVSVKLICFKPYRDSLLIMTNIENLIFWACCNFFLSSVTRHWGSPRSLPFKLTTLQALQSVCPGGRRDGRSPGERGATQNSRKVGWRMLLYVRSAIRCGGNHTRLAWGHWEPRWNDSKESRQHWKRKYMGELRGGSSCLLIFSKK